MSKLFTDLAAMRLVEAGKLDLDAPVDRTLPDFRPKNSFDIPITPRQLMSHRAGLVRESPVGNYFDATSSTLAATVESLNQTELVFKPGARTKYSNAGVAVLGRVLEQATGEPFQALIKRLTIEPMGLKRSFFEPGSGPSDNRARGLMWSYDGRTFNAPTFFLGTPPAGNLDSTVLDLGRFLEVLFAGGKTPNGRILKEETLRAMWDPQFAKKGDATTFGLGFTIGELDGAKRIGHGGAVYGFATELAALPAEKLGAVVIASRNGANGSTRHIADLALRLMRAAREGQPLPRIESTSPVPLDLARGLEGRYGTGQDAIDLDERGGKLFLTMLKGGFRVEVRSIGADLVVNDQLAQRVPLKVQADKEKNPSRVVFLGKTLDRVPDESPQPAPERWNDLIGEYGWDYNTLFILEKDRKLHALIEWFYLYPLEEVSPTTFKFPDWGLYEGETLVFTRDDRGSASRVVAANVAFPRRPIPGEDGKTFRIQALRPYAELRKEALSAEPPRERGDFRESDLVEPRQVRPHDQTRHSICFYQ